MIERVSVEAVGEVPPEVIWDSLRHSTHGRGNGAGHGPEK